LAVGISTTFLTDKRSILRIAGFVREVNPGLKIVMGGPGIINFPGARRHADINVISEGEETLVELASCLRRGMGIADVKGVSYFTGGREIFTQKRGVY